MPNGPHLHANFPVGAALRHKPGGVQPTLPESPIDRDDPFGPIAGAGRPLPAPKSGSLGRQLALLALYNLAFIAPFVLFLMFVSNRRVFGTLGRWNRQNGSTVKVVLAVAVIAMSFGLLLSM